MPEPPRRPGPSPEYASTLRYLWGLKRLGTRPGPELTALLLRELGDPHRSFSSVHVTGSKGKGSVSALIASVFQAAGRRTGLYTSPHLLSYRERAQVDGRPATPAEVVRGIARVRRAMDALERGSELFREATYFEVTTAWAFDHFARRHADSAAIEVGIGGRLDATNVLQAPVTVITSLELEHTELLGSTLREIAREKSGIFHRDAWAVTGVTEGEGLEEVRRQAAKLGVPLWVLGKEVRVEHRESALEGQTLDVVTPEATHRGLSLPLLGTFQARNAAVAVAALDLFQKVTGRTLPERAYQEGFGAVRWPGRLERLSSAPLFYLDATHTPESAKEVAASLRELHPDREAASSVLLYSSLSDKRVGENLAALRPVAETVAVFPLASERAADPELLRREARAHFPRVFALPSVAEAVRWGRGLVGPRGLLLAAGGVYLAGAVLEVVRGVPHEGPDLTDPISSPRPRSRRRVP